ncbi:hypothetical protein PF005_g26794 [Phytophthora fragariae]|uniref:Uncharacterized protein n=2 Tax=Phytophthora fragariae TaxID=53985 RepID=A0A6A3DTR5_9STRA|nr:hypothetical protein PF003_g38785 [Phytophthora fragariae]KAE8923526.1 hypothetical protein PF009_g26226 [Phytophthora fragariae]KAE9070431.1 hypothetical protein PF010_g26276 [Phytophthora fragariae]KAE9074737.1 hypothetical protein PF007_g25291 [Phytophthora fragariae]KAE9087477.1 hypothetical protein PF006_g25799 [Phytophthora fragariae]
MPPTEAPSSAPALPAPVSVRAPPPPVPTSAPEPAPEAEPMHAPMPPTKRKHRGLMRAIGGLFKRKSSDAYSATPPSDSEASQHTTSRWSRWSQSHRQLLPDAPMEVAAVAVPEAAPIQENESPAPSVMSAVSASVSGSVSAREPSVASASRASSSRHAEEPPAKKAKKVWEMPRREKKPAKQSPTDPSELLLAADSDDESGVEPTRVSFLFFGGSDVDSTFQPELRPSELDDLHENEIRPSLQVKMPLFFSPPLVENMRRSNILPDPKEYEF